MRSQRSLRIAAVRSRVLPQSFVHDVPEKGIRAVACGSCSAGVSATKRTYFSPFTKDSRALSPLAITPIIGTLWCTSCNERQLVYLVDSPIGSAGVACGMHSRGLRVVVLMPCWSHNPRICICAAAVHIACSSSLVVPSRPFG